MKNILIHGLGQNDKSWDKTKILLNEKDIDVECPNLFDLKCKMSYEDLYSAFANYCNESNDKLNLCGLSLGGLLALEYSKEYPDKVNSMILIGTPYKISKLLFKVQSIVFKCMSNKTFEKMGISKKDFCCLVNSMSDIEISKNIKSINCNSLILCGVKDKANKKSAELFAQNIKNSVLEIVGNSSHEVNIDNPKDLAYIIYDFWKEN